MSKMVAISRPQDCPHRHKISYSVNSCAHPTHRDKRPFLLLCGTSESDTSKFPEACPLSEVREE